MTPLASRAVLDSFALLAFLKAERGADRVQRYLEAARARRAHLFVNLLNVGEVFYITYRKVGERRAFETWGLVKNLPVELVHSEESLVLQAALFKGQYPLAYADALAAATAMSRKAVLVTGDPEFKPLAHTIEMDWL